MTDASPFSANDTETDELTLGRIVAFRMLLQSEDRPCVMHAEDDCSADFPCVECPLAPESEKRTR